MEPGILIIIFTGIVSLGLFLFFRKKSWICKEGKCEQVISGGMYTSQERCKQACSCKFQKSVTFKDDITKIPKKDYEDHYSLV